MTHPDGTQLRWCPNKCRKPLAVARGDGYCGVCGEWLVPFVVKNVTCQACGAPMVMHAGALCDPPEAPVEPGCDGPIEELCPECGQPSGIWSDDLLYVRQGAPYPKATEAVQS